MAQPAIYMQRVIHIYVSAVASGLCFVWRLILSMIDTLEENWPILDTTVSVKYPSAPGNYQIVCKYQSDLSRILHLLVCYFEAVDVEEYGVFYSGLFTLTSTLN